VSESIDLEGQVVVVTGGGRGVGRGISERFLEAGAEVVVCGRKRPEAPPATTGRAGSSWPRRARARADRAWSLIDAFRPPRRS
jgi:NAD(P)-dependent dehydrogenase (short-subunit alcohol dehydrogenase family)